MESSKHWAEKITMRMASTEVYRKKAEGYRSSEAYSKMIGLYPVLQTSINECLNEELVN